ncbi:UDP-N-acetylmuramoyl-tripeptide--D-alanyl-D-alanine ligase [Thalassobacillus sp. CUG 92003]|uniref:UDP-N-acetylmuramoyl-tripeptide--D-alanyl-D- alanine ligase n=1 Tax=Thalassobacillus sp. CUG 92003 TaxID=2736641 RepID=UPI0015E6EC2F|nr:UDP-N-acetylmuramoyl-tripeptide--D-alanyl-D-alanine ligase [Thalassobacillus sp. CUG 92003]
MNLLVQELSALFPTSRGAVDDAIHLSAVMTDSRITLRNSLFVPIVGEQFDAHDYLGEAIQNGAVAVLWQKDKHLPYAIPNDFPVFFVEDTVQALQQTAHFYKSKVAPVVVGITGSNGKTTTKDMTASVLSEAFVVHKTAGNYNNHIGLPLTLLAMPEDTEVAVLEMGMNNAGEIGTLSKIAEPDYGIITNIGESHIENLGSREGIAQAKLEIREGMSRDGTLIVDGDEALLHETGQNVHTIRCGTTPESDVVITERSPLNQGSHFKIGDKGYFIPLSGNHNIKNASFVITLAKAMKMSPDLIEQGLKNIEITGMRFERISGKNGSLIINDAYNASPTSMKAVIASLAERQEKKKMVLVLGDMYELGSHSKPLHRSVAASIGEEFEAVFTIGEDAKEITDELTALNRKIMTRHFDDKEVLTQNLERYLDNDTVILVKASRGMKLEEIIEGLVE